MASVLPSSEPCSSGPDGVDISWVPDTGGTRPPEVSAMRNRCGYSKGDPPPARCPEEPCPAAYSKPRCAGSTQGCGITKCATPVRTRTTGTARTTLRYMPPIQVLALDGRSNGPIMTVASSVARMTALISDARTGSKCGGHIAERLTAHPQLGKTGWAIQRTSSPSRTIPAATTGGGCVNRPVTVFTRTVFTRPSQPPHDSQVRESARSCAPARRFGFDRPERK